MISCLESKLVKSDAWINMKGETLSFSTSHSHLWCMAGCCSGRSSSSWRVTGRGASPPCGFPRTSRRCRMLRRTVWGPARWGTETAGSGYVWTFSPTWLCLWRERLDQKCLEDPVDQSEWGSEDWGSFRDTTVTSPDGSRVGRGGLLWWLKLTHGGWQSGEERKGGLGLKCGAKVRGKSDKRVAWRAGVQWGGESISGGQRTAEWRKMTV